MCRSKRLKTKNDTLLEEVLFRIGDGKESEVDDVILDDVSENPDLFIGKDF